MASDSQGSGKNHAGKDQSHIDPIHRVGDKLLFENGRVRVWELALEPGAESHAHEHPHDYLMICVEGDNVAGKATPGQPDAYGPAGDFVDIPTFPGHTLFVEGGVTETAVNTGTTTYRNILVELLENGAE